jgi:hypothetical protein
VTDPVDPACRVHPTARQTGIAPARPAGIAVDQPEPTTGRDRIHVAGRRDRRSRTSLRNAWPDGRRA